MLADIYAIDKGDHILVHYEKIVAESESIYIEVCALTKNNGEVEFSSPIKLTAPDHLLSVGIVSINKTKSIIIYHKRGHMYAQIAQVKDGVAELVNEPMFLSEVHYYTNTECIKINDNKILVTYATNDWELYAQLINFNDDSNEISVMQPIKMCDNVVAAYIDICNIADNKCLIVYNNPNHRGRMLAQMVYIGNDGDINISSPVIVNDDRVEFIKLYPINENKVLIAFSNTDQDSRLYTQVIDINEDGTIVPEPQIKRNNICYTEFITLKDMGNDKVIIAYHCPYKTGHYMQILDVVTNEVSKPIQLTTECGTGYNAIATLDKNTMVFLYEYRGKLDFTIIEV
jgi:hypothetical protein